MKKILSITITAVLFASAALIACKKKTAQSPLVPIAETSKQTRSQNYSELGLDITEVSAAIETHPDAKAFINAPFLVSELSRFGARVLAPNCTKHIDKITRGVAYSFNLEFADGSTGCLVARKYGAAGLVFESMICKVQQIGTASSNTTFALLNGNSTLGGYEALPNSWQQWKDCFTASWNTLTDDLTGALACSLAPPSCIAAIVIHCGFEPAHNLTSNADILTWLCNNGYINCNGVVTNAYSNLSIALITR
jgi:hypothetical protein